MLAQQDDAGVGDEEHQQGDETDPDALFETGLVELGLVYLGQQEPIRARDRIDDAKGRYASIIHTGKHPGFSLSGLKAQILGRQQGAVMERKLQAQGRVGAIAQVTQILHLVCVLAKQRGFATAVGDGPGVEDLVYPVAAAYLQHYDGRRPRRRGQGRQEVEPGLALFIQIRPDPEHLACCRPGQGIAQRGIHDARPRSLPQGLAGPVEEGRAIESPHRDELDQPLGLFIGRPAPLPGEREGTITRVVEDLTKILFPVAQPLGDAPALEIGDGFKSGDLLVPGQPDVLGDGHYSQGQNEAVEQYDGQPLAPGEPGTGRGLTDAAAQHGIEHERGDEDKEPALDGAGQGELGRGAEEPLHRLVRQQDPQTCHGGIGEYHVEHVGSGQGRLLSHGVPRRHPDNARR
ncbi:hypothetical protein D3C85_934790 [compost metagenome]